MWVRANGCGVFPTRVGMNRYLQLGHIQLFRIPHTRGDEPTVLDCLQLVTTYSPHAWG